MKLELEGKTVLITGASKGIGLAAAHSFAAEGCHLQLAARDGIALAAAYVQLRIGNDRSIYGVGLDSNIVTATLRAVVSAVDRACGRGWASVSARKVATPVAGAVA